MMIVHFNCKSFIQSWGLCLHSWISLICKILVLPVLHFIAGIYGITNSLWVYCSFIVSNIGYETNSRESGTCLRSLWATSCIMGFSSPLVLQNNRQWFICSVRSSRALIQTHRVILMLRVAMKYHNCSAGIPHFPVPTPTRLHCFGCMCAQRLCFVPCSHTSILLS